MSFHSNGECKYTDFFLFRKYFTEKDTTEHNHFITGLQLCTLRNPKLDM